MTQTIGLPRPLSAEWLAFEAQAEELRWGLARELEARFAGDPRVSLAPDVSFDEIAEEAFALAFEQWRAKPAAVAPATWMRRHATSVLEATLDAAALAAESAGEEREAERGEAIASRADAEEGRRQWSELVDPDDEGAPVLSITEELGSFDLLVCDPLVSSPEDRMREHELLAEIGRALQGLPDRLRRAVAHRYLDGLPMVEVAYLLECTETEARQAVTSGLAELRRRVRV